MSHPAELLSAHLDGELTPQERSLVASHLSDCERCRSELEDLHRARAALRSLPLLEIPPGLIGVGETPTPVHRQRGIWVGAAAAIVVGVVAVAALLSPAPATISIDDLSSRFGARASLDPGFGPAKVIIPEFEVGP